MIENKIKDALLTIKENNYFVIDSMTGNEYTYMQCFSLAKKVSSHLLTLESNSVAVILENGYPFFVLYFACIFANITIIPIDPQKGIQEIREILDNHRGIPVICENDKLVGEYDVHQIQNIFSYDGLEKIEMQTVWNNVNLDKVYMITYTSGSTGKAKGVKHSLRNLFWSAISFGESMNYDEQSVLCHTMPMAYMAGILNTIFLPFIMHSRIVIFPRFSVMSAIYFWKNVVQYMVNTFWLSPTMLNILMTIDKRGDIKEYFAQNSSVFNIGTASLYPELKKAFELKYGVTLYQSYGLSETLFLSTAPMDHKVPDSSVGNLLEEVDLKFIDDGEILINVPWMFVGYTDQNEKDFFSEDYYMSGDLGELKNSNLFITGRKKDLIVRGGMNISPVQIEKEIYKYQEIQECCVSGVVINGEEQTVCWYVAQTSEHKKLEHKINTDLINNLGTNYKIDCFEKVKNITKNLNGKIDKNEMKKMFT